MRKYVLNLFAASLGILRPWDVFVERRFHMALSWSFPLVFIGLTLLSISARDLGSGIGYSFLSIVVLFFYGVFWVISSSADSFRGDLPMNPSAGGSSFVMLVFFTVLWPLSSIGGLFVGLDAVRDIRVYQALPWWVYAHFILLFGLASVASLTPLRVIRKGCFRSADMIAFASPFFGLQGVPYFLKGAYGKGIGFLTAGWGLLILLFWVGLSTRNLAVGSREILSIFLLHAAPLVYLGMGLWTVAEFHDEMILSTKASTRSTKASTRSQEWVPRHSE